VQLADVNETSRLTAAAVRAAEYLAGRDLDERPVLLALVPAGDTYTLHGPERFKHANIGLVDERGLLRRRYASALTRTEPNAWGPVLFGAVSARRCRDGVHVTAVTRDGRCCDLHWRCCGRARIGTVADACSDSLPEEVVKALRGEPVYLRPLAELAETLGVDPGGDAATLHDRILHVWKSGRSAPDGLDPVLWALLGDVCPGPRDLEELLTGVWRPLAT
jgi:hypothetical protein